MIFEIREIDGVKEIKCDGYKKDTFLNLIDINQEMGKIFKLYKETTNDSTKTELVKTMTILKDLSKFIS